MKKFIVFLLAAAIIIFAAACNGQGGAQQDPPREPESPTLSSDTGLIVNSVLGKIASGGSVTLTTPEYNELSSAENLAEICDFTLAKGANAQITLNGRKLVFSVTAESGVTKDYAVNLEVLSDSVTFTPLSIAGKAVNGGKIILSESEYTALTEENDIISATEYVSDASVTAKLDGANGQILFEIVSEDKTKTSEYAVSAIIESPFGVHAKTGKGAKENAEYNFSEKAFVLNGMAAIKAGNEIAQNYFNVSLDVSPMDFKAGSEVVLAAYQTDNLMLRFVLRGEEDNTFVLFSDYRDMSDYLGYKELKRGSLPEKEFISLRIISDGKSLVMLYGDETLYRNTLETLTDVEPIIYTHQCKARLKNIGIETDAIKISAAYNAALNGYTERLYGNSLLNTMENTDKIRQNSDGSLSIAGSESNARVMAALYSGGRPAGGYRYAVKGTVDISKTKTTGGSASKVEFQICKNFQNFIKFQLYRFPTNNSFLAFPTVSGKNSEIKILNNTMPQGTEYTIDYVFAYDNGVITAWLKDDSYLNEFTELYRLETDWGYTSYVFAMRQYCDTEWRNTEVFYGEEFDKLMNGLYNRPTTFGLSASKEELTKNEVFILKNNIFLKNDDAYGSAFVFNGTDAVSGDHWLLSGSISLFDCLYNGYGEITLYGDRTHLARYALEYVAGGFFQVRAQLKNDAENTDYEFIIPPNVTNPAALNFTVVNDGGTLHLLIDGKLRHTFENTGMSGLFSKITADKTSVKLSLLYSTRDRAEVENFTSNMEKYEYVSPYENRIASLAAQYSGAQKGGVLLAGSSSMDFWSSWQTDIGSGVLGYNVGIGGTLVEDWMYAYERLVKPFEPSKIILFLGGNNVNNLKDSGEQTTEKLGRLLTKMHDDFPDAKIYYILSMPVPYNYNNGQYTYEYGRLVTEMREYCAARDWVTAVDMEQALLKDGNPVPEYFKSDGMHLTEAGYAVWTQELKKAGAID
ncbi:MAG: GDSL-type esterase/lipase family protein [Christensenellales bacterium]